MKRLSLRGAAFLAVLAGLAAGASGMEVYDSEKGLVIDKASLSIDGRLQILGVGEVVKDPVRNDGRLYLYLKQARLRFHGNLDSVKYDMQLAFAGEDEVKSGQNASLNLLDFAFDVPLAAGVTLKIGQFKVPYSRERLVEGGSQLFADRSIGNVAWRVGRDVGGAVYGRKNNWAGTAGVFTGGGRDVPERYLPERLGVPMLVARVGYDTGIDKDLYRLDQTVGHVDKPQVAVFGNVLYMRDTNIGHNVVLGLKTSETPLLLNKNWNPFIGKTYTDQYGNAKALDAGDLMQAGGDFVYKTPLGGATLAIQGEGNYASFTNTFGRLDISGGMGIVALAKGDWEVATRYSYLSLDPKMTPGGGTKLVSRRPIQEITPAITYHFKKGRSKLILDLPILVNTPVLIEKTLGAYVLVPEQPDQTQTANPSASSYVAGSQIVHRTVVEGRILYQLSF